jgi:predicted dehydrogenase
MAAKVGPLKVGVIACGAIGQRRHIPEAAANPEIALLAVCDTNEPRAKEVAKKYGAKAYADFRKLLKHPGLEAVVVCGPNYLHASQSIAALDAGKHVLVEKPMATTREDAKAMIAAAERNGKFLMVGQNQRLMSPHVKAKKLLDAGAIGKVMSFRTAFQHGGPESWSLDGIGSWFFRKDEAVMGVTGDLGVHKIDLMRYLLGQEFVQVSAKLATLDKRTPDGSRPIDTDDNAYLTVTTDKGVLGSILISWTMYGSGLEENYTYIYGDKGVMAIGADKDYGVVVYHRDGTRDLHKVGSVSTNTLQVSSGVIDLFARCVLTNTPPTISGSEGYKALNVILTAMDADKSGKTLKVV